MICRVHVKKFCRLWHGRVDTFIYFPVAARPSLAIIREITSRIHRQTHRETAISDAHSMRRVLGHNNHFYAYSEVSGQLPVSPNDWWRTEWAHWGHIARHGWCSTLELPSFGIEKVDIFAWCMVIYIFKDTPINGTSENLVYTSGLIQHG